MFEAWTGKARFKGPAMQANDNKMSRISELVTTIKTILSLITEAK